MNTGDLQQSKNNINNLGFDSVWSGAAYEAQNQALEDLMTKLEKAIADIDKFDEALELKEDYINICNKLTSLYNSMRGCDLDTEEGKNAYSSYSSQASTLEVERTELRNKIIGILSQFSGIEAETGTMVDLSVDDSISLYDIDTLVDIYNNPSVLALNSTGLFGLYDQYDAEGNLIQSGEDYVNEQIRNVTAQCTDGRQAAVNVGLLLLQLAADKGVKLKYENEGANGGLNWGNINWDQNTGNYTYTEGSGLDPNVVYNQGYNNITQVQEGMDCCAWVSYLVNVGSSSDPGSTNPQGFHWEGVPGLLGFGEQVPPSEVQAGDVFIWGNEGNPYAHTGMVVDIKEDPNNPGTGTIVVTESGGKYSWLSINEYPYTTNENGTINMGSHGGTILLDYTDVYNGTQVNHDSLQGYHPEAPENN